MVKHLQKVNPYVIASLAPWLVFEIKQEKTRLINPAMFTIERKVMRKKNKREKKIK